MDFTVLGKVIAAIGIVVLLYGGGTYVANRPETFDPSKSEPSMFGGRNDLRNMLQVQVGNVEREAKRSGAASTAAWGLGIAVVGAGIVASAKRPS